MQDELYQLENKQAKVAKFCVNIRWELLDEKCSKSFFKLLKRQNPPNQIIISDYIISKYSSSSKDILKSSKKFYKNTLHQGVNFQSFYYWISY